jgi:hypothetical protein
MDNRYNILEEPAANIFRTEDPLFYSEDIGRRFLQNAGTYLPNYTASNSRSLYVILIFIAVRTSNLT